jgi:hypothetical protein
MSEDTAPITVTKADQVNVGVGGTHLPYVWVLAAVTGCILLGFAAVTFWVLAGEPGKGIDTATKGALIQTWNNLALLGPGSGWGCRSPGNCPRRPIRIGLAESEPRALAVPTPHKGTVICVFSPSRRFWRSLPVCPAVQPTGRIRTMSARTRSACACRLRRR